jgi:ubiquitin-protein ligase
MKLKIIGNMENNVIKIKKQSKVYTNYNNNFNYNTSKKYLQNLLYQGISLRRTNLHMHDYDDNDDDDDDDNDSDEFKNNYYGNNYDNQKEQEQNIVNNNEKILAFQKLKEEYISLKSNPITNIGLNILNLPDENNIFEWVFSINGPKDTSYSGGTFYLKAYFPDNYPLKAPEICFITPIYHVNINYIFPLDKYCLKLGHISINTLDLWKPEYNMTKVLTDIFGLLYIPNPENPLGIDIAEECKKNKQLYEKKIKYFTEKYANNQIGYKEYNSDWDFSYPN